MYWEIAPGLCINNMLPYLPQREGIEYFLFQDNEAFSLNVTVVVRQNLNLFNFMIGIIF